MFSLKAVNCSSGLRFIFEEFLSIPTPLFSIADSKAMQSTVTMPVPTPAYTAPEFCSNWNDSLLPGISISLHSVRFLLMQYNL